MDLILSSFADSFSELDRRSRQLIERIDDERLFVRPNGDSDARSCGECIVRSAAMVERTFNGITTRLWDDPFEWTLPEKLNNRSAVLGYLGEVEVTRTRGFAFFASDDDLRRQIPAPEKLTQIVDILIDALVRASHFQGRAFTVFTVLTGERPPGG